MGRNARRRKAAREAARPPGRTVTLPAREWVYDVDVNRSEPDPACPDDVPGWSAEAGLSGESTGVDIEWTEDLAQLVDDVAQDVAVHRVMFELEHPPPRMLVREHTALPLRSNHMTRQSRPHQGH